MPYLVMNVVYLPRVFVPHYYYAVIGIFKNSEIKSKIIKTEGLAKKKIQYMKHIKIQSCHMGIIFMPKHLMWQRLQCAHILSLVMHFHTGNYYFRAVPTFHVSISLTKKQIIRVQT